MATRTHMIFRNTSWGAVLLFRSGYIFSFCFGDGVDYSFSWGSGSQASAAACECFGGSYRGFCWSSNR